MREDAAQAQCHAVGATCPNEAGFAGKPFYAGMACGWCIYVCNCGEFPGDGDSAILLCTGGEVDCNGVVDFKNPLDNECTPFCNRQRCKKQKEQEAAEKEKSKE